MGAGSELDTLTVALRKEESGLIRQIIQLARVESPGDNKAAVNRAVSLVESWGVAVGGSSARHKGLMDETGEFGDVLELHFPSQLGSKREKPVLLLGHLDTVWDLGTLARMPIRKGKRDDDPRDRDWLFGPGVYDMKAGVVMALTAIRLLQQSQSLNRAITLLLVSDEEVGSPVSRVITEKIALRSSEVYVLEPAQGRHGAYKTARKGVGGYRLEVQGIAAHSGVDFTSGHSAVLELARQIDVLGGFTDMERGLTVNPGVIGGGSRSNVVAASAWVEIDVRVARKSDVARIERRLRGLKPFDRRCKLKLTGGLNRPPMERTPATAALFRRAASLARGLGFELEEAATGGGSDGNFTSALGLPTLDGMGAVGHGAHASDESILIDALVPRTALLAAMLMSA